MINETVAGQLEQELRGIADYLEAERCKIFQQDIIATSFRLL